MEGADTVVSPRRVSPPGEQHGPGRRRTGHGRRLRHQRQRQHQAPVGNVTVVRTVQKGSAVVPLSSPGIRVPVHPDPAKTQRTLVQYPSVPEPSPPPANLVRAPSGVSPQYRNDPTGLASCPGDRTVLAPKGQDYVLMEKITAKDGTPLDVIAGPQAGDPVPEGPHPVVGRLVALAAPLRRQQQQPTLCRLTYTVIVRRCGPPPPLSTSSGIAPRRPRCTADTAWGSRCHYRCPRRDLLLRGNTWVQCEDGGAGDDLRWVGRPPVCAERHRAESDVVSEAPPALRRSCPVPGLPEHGLVSCRARPRASGLVQDADDEDANDPQRLLEGSECTVSCMAPHRLQLPRAVSARTSSAGTAFLVTLCTAGRWNVTSWMCARGEVPDVDVDGDIAAVLSDAGGSLQDQWNWRENSVSNPCSPNPCHSGGTCLRGPRKSRALCQCRPGTEGDRCERILCRGTCLHAGRCVLVQGQPSCFCRRGYAGSHCQAIVKNVRYPAPTLAPTSSASSTPPSTPTPSWTSSTTPTSSSAGTPTAPQPVPFPEETPNG